MPPQDAETARWFAQEVLPHEGALRAYLRHSVQSLADADDLMQECYARILKQRDRAEVRIARALLFAVARNAVRDYLRRRATAPLVAITEMNESCVMEDEPGVADVVSRRQEIALLHEAIRALPERCREVFLLRKIQGLPQREIATRLGITENTVETLVAKGAHRCTEYLGKHGIGAHQASGLAVKAGTARVPSPPALSIPSSPSIATS